MRGVVDVVPSKCFGPGDLRGAAQIVSQKVGPCYPPSASSRGTASRPDEAAAARGILKSHLLLPRNAGPNNPEALDDFVLLSRKTVNVSSAGNRGTRVTNEAMAMKNGVVERLDFDPPLCAGGTVSFGFYTWVKEHFALTESEAVRRYNDR